MDHQDAFWVERARRGDHAAFGLLVEKYAAEITRFLASKIANIDDAHDVAQELWLHTYLSLGRLREPGKFRQWVYGIARNRALMWLRQTHSTTTLQECLPDNLADGASSDDLIAAWELRDAVLGAIAQLSEVNREAVQLHYLHDLSYSEIAARLHVSVKTVKSRLHKARQQLKPHLHEMTADWTLQEEHMTEATIYDVYLAQRADTEEAHTVVVLKAQAEDRYLPIWIGQAEAESIAAPLRSLTIKRPLPYDLMAQLVERLSGQINRVELNALRNQTFFAVLKVAAKGSNFDLDCRPSDALALAVRTNTPIFIADDLLVEAGTGAPTEFREYHAPPIKSIQPLQLELFKYGGSSKHPFFEQKGT